MLISGPPLSTTISNNPDYFGSLLLRNLAKLSSAQPYQSSVGVGPSGNSYLGGAEISGGGVDNDSDDVAAGAFLTNCTVLNDRTPCDLNDFKTTTPLFEYASQYSLWLTIVLATLAGAASIVTVLGNLLVLVSFVLDRQIRQPGNYFIASLAVTDFLIGLFSMPLYTMYLLLGFRWPLGTIACDLWLSLDYTVCLTSQYTVFFITLDRYCSVSYPARYRAWRTEKKLKVMVLLTWMLPALIFYVSIIGWPYFVGERTVPINMCYVQFMENPLFNTVLVISYYWTTLVVITVLYVGIYRIALDMARKSQAKRRIAENVIQQSHGQRGSITAVSGFQSQGQTQHMKSAPSETGLGSPTTAFCTEDPVSHHQTISSSAETQQQPPPSQKQQAAQSSRLYSATKQRSVTPSNWPANNKSRQSRNTDPHQSDETPSESDHPTPRRATTPSAKGRDSAKPTNENANSSNRSPGKLGKGKNASETSLSFAGESAERGRRTSSSGYSGESPQSRTAHTSTPAAPGTTPLKKRPSIGWFRIKVMATVFRRLRPISPGTRQSTPTIHVEQVPLVECPGQVGGRPPSSQRQTPPVPVGQLAPLKKAFDPSDFGGIYLGPTAEKYLAAHKKLEAEQTAANAASENGVEESSRLESKPEPPDLPTIVDDKQLPPAVVASAAEVEAHPIPDNASITKSCSKASSLSPTRSTSLRLNNDERTVLSSRNDQGSTSPQPPQQEFLPPNDENNEEERTPVLAETEDTSLPLELQTSTGSTSELRRLLHVGLSSSCDSEESPTPSTDRSRSESRQASLSHAISDNGKPAPLATVDTRSTYSNRTMTVDERKSVRSSADSLSFYGLDNGRKAGNRHDECESEVNSISVGAEIAKIMSISSTSTSSSIQMPFSGSLSSSTSSMQASRQTSRSSILSKNDANNNSGLLLVLPSLTQPLSPPPLSPPSEPPNSLPLSVQTSSSVSTQVSPTMLRALEREKYNRAIRPPKLDIVIRAPPEALCGIRWADSESVLSFNSQDTVRILPEYMEEMSMNSSTSTAASTKDSEPSSPIWIRRNSGHKMSTLHCLHELPEHGILSTNSINGRMSASAGPVVEQSTPLVTTMGPSPAKRLNKPASLPPPTGWGARRLKFYNRHFANLIGFEQLQVSIIPAAPDEDAQSQKSGASASSSPQLKLKPINNNNYTSNNSPNNDLKTPTPSKSSSSPVPFALTAATTSSTLIAADETIQKADEIIINTQNERRQEMLKDALTTSAPILLSSHDESEYICPAPSSNIISNTKSEPNVTDLMMMTDEDVSQMSPRLPLSQSAITAISAPPACSTSFASADVICEIPQQQDRTYSLSFNASNKNAKRPSGISKKPDLKDTSPLTTSATSPTTENNADFLLEIRNPLLAAAGQHVEILLAKRESLHPLGVESAAKRDSITTVINKPTTINEQDKNDEKQTGTNSGTTENQNGTNTNNNSEIKTVPPVRVDSCGTALSATAGGSGCGHFFRQKFFFALGRASTAATLSGDDAMMTAAARAALTNRRRSNRKQENRATKALRTITFILGAFVLTWTPYHILAIIKGFCNECVDDGLYSISYWLCYVASPLNPFCYAFANKQFKKTFLRILRGDIRSY